MTEQQLVAIQIPLNRIHPDPKQPRRLLPVDLAEALVAGTAPLDILSQLRSRSKRDKSIHERLEELDGLADSIAADGLMQPIRVIEDEANSYRIEQGERRWWAHHILVGRREGRFESIPAFVISKHHAEKSGVLRRQVAENVLRSGFTAIELARAMATRMEEIALEEPTLARREIEKRVGKENAMSDRRVRQYLALLTLPAEVQEFAQLLRLTESSLRSLVAIKDPARQVAAARALIDPRRNQSQSHNISRSEKRNKSPRLAKRAPKKPGRAIKVADISRLITLARKIQTQSFREASHALKKMIINSNPDRNAIIHLRALLNRGLAGNEHPNSTGSNTLIHKLVRRKAAKR